MAKRHYLRFGYLVGLGFCCRPNLRRGACLVYQCIQRVMSEYHAYIPESLTFRWASFFFFSFFFVALSGITTLTLFINNHCRSFANCCWTSKPTIVLTNIDSLSLPPVQPNRTRSLLEVFLRAKHTIPYTIRLSLLRDRLASSTNKVSDAWRFI